VGVGATDSDNRFSFGIALQYVYGKIESTMAQEYFAEPENSIMMTSSTELDGFATTAGMAYRFNERMDLAATFNSGLHVQGDQNSVLYSELVDPIVASDVDESIRYPRNYSLGMAYYPRSELKTVFTMEAVFSEWSELEDDSMEEGPFLEDTIDFRVGVQHTFYNGVPLRFGFRHRDSYSDSEASVSYFTSGVGVPYGGGIISASVELSKTSSYQEHWFEYPNTNDFPVDPISRVEETRFRLGVGYRYMF
jgi:long-subunit fatty acid transport protein